MIEKNLSGMSPVKLRMALMLSIIAIIILSAAGFWFYKGWLESYAATVNESAQKADVSTNDITTLQNLKAQLEDNKVAVNRTKSIVADSKSYGYQTQIINDIDAYAKTSGVSISGYGFASDTATTGAPATPDPAAPAANPAGLKTTAITVTIKNPVKYESVMNFIHSIESNLTKMQLSGINLKKDGDASGQFVTVDPLNVEVYIR